MFVFTFHQHGKQVAQKEEDADSHIPFQDPERLCGGV